MAGLFQAAEEGAEALAQDFCVGDEVLVLWWKQPPALELCQGVLDFVHGAECLADVLCELCVAVQTAAFRNVEVNRHCGARDLIAECSLEPYAAG